MKRIMVVDDDPGIVELVSRGLKRAEYEVETALGGKECLEKFDDFKPNLILLDIMMPDIDGWKVLNELVDNHDIHDTIIVMLTAKPLDEMDAKREQFEFLSHYIQKPFGMKELVEEIGKVFTEEESLHEEGEKISQSFGKEFATSYLGYLKLATRRQRIITGIMDEETREIFKDCPEKPVVNDLVQSVDKISRAVREIESELETIRDKVKTLL